MEPIRISELEAIINRARSALPAQGAEATLSPDVALLAGIYGRMIYLHQEVIGAEALEPVEQQALARWRADGAPPTAGAR